jgi:hypothetical protein
MGHKFAACFSRTFADIPGHFYGITIGCQMRKSLEDLQQLEPVFS